MEVDLQSILEKYPKLLRSIQRHPKLQAFLELVIDMINIYNIANVPRGAAALSYFLTMSVFPVLICVHAILASFSADITPLLESLDYIIPENTIQIIVDYLSYVGAQNNGAILTAGLLATATTSAAAFRSIHYIMADIQGEPRFRGIWTLLVSFIFSLFFLAAIYFAILVMVAGNWLISLVNEWLPHVTGLGLWAWLRYPILFVVFIFIIYGIYKINAPKNVKHGFFPGAVSVSVLLVLVSMLFSYFVGLSSRYPLIYGSLASIIIFMIWMYFCGQILIMGNALNVVLRRKKQLKIDKMVDERPN